MEEPREEVALLPSLGERGEHRALQVVQVGRGEGGEVPVLGVAPDGLDRVELGGIGGQPLDDDPRMLGQPRRDAARPVRAVPIPDESEAVGQVAAQLLEEPEDLAAPDVVAMQGPVEAKPAAARGDRERADRREAIPPIPLAEHWGLAPGRPRPATDRLEHEATLVNEHQGPTGAAGVF